MTLYRERCVVDPAAPLESLGIDLREKDHPITLGNFVDIERPVFDPLAMMRPAPENNAVGKRQEGQ
jgi:hypothetical protein